MLHTNSAAAKEELLKELATFISAEGATVVPVYEFTGHDEYGTNAIVTLGPKIVVSSNKV